MKEEQLFLSIESSLSSCREDFSIKLVNQLKKFAIDILRDSCDFIISENSVFQGLKESNFFIDVFLIDDEKMVKINFLNRGIKETTNVISLAFFSKEEVESYRMKQIHLGEIFISMPTLKKEAEEIRVSLEHHFARLLIHGLLHLLGYDHAIEKDAVIMYNLESILLEKSKLPINSIVSNFWR